MAYEMKDNSGSLFKNDKEGKESRPDYKGSMKIEGVDYWLSAWIKKSDGKPPWMSLSLERKDKQSPPAAKSEPEPIADPDSVSF